MDFLIPGGLNRADSRIARQINMHSVFELLRVKKQLRVAEIARHTGLSVSTVKYVLVRLMEMKLIASVGEGDSTGGRKPTIYALNLAESVLCGVEVTVDRITVGILSLDGTVLWKYAEELATGDAVRLVAAIERIVRRGVAALALAWDHLIGAAVCVPGFVDGRGKTIVLDINVGLRDLALGDTLQERLGMPVFVIEEANAWLLAELEYGTLPLPDDSLFILIGSGLGKGIGGAIMSGGAVMTGSRGFSGEIGHVTIDPEGPECSCGRRGCWEALGSLSGLVDEARAAVPELARSSYASVLRELITLVESREPRVTPLFRRFVELHAEGVANLIHVLDPQAVVIGGEVTLFGDLFVEPLRERVGRLVMRPFRAGYTIRLSTVAENNALLGSVALLIQKAIALRQEGPAPSDS